MTAEGPPTDQPENTKGKKKKKSKAFGHLVVDREASKKPAEGKSEHSIFNSDDKEEKKPESVPEVENKPEDAEAVEVPAAEAPDESIGEENEKPEVKAKLVEVIEELEAETPADPETDPPIEEFRERIKAGEDEDAVFEDVMEKLGAEESDLETPEEEIEDSDVETGTEEIPQESDEELVFDRSAEVAAEEEPEDPTQTPAGPGTPPPTPPPAPPSPQGPTPPFGAPHSPNFNPALAPPTPATAPNRPRHEQIDDRASPAAMALMGGIIGYLIGRRRGRIKTEKKLLPIQKKLEKQVTNLQFELQEKEKKIRRVAAAKVKQQGPAVIEVFNKPPAVEEKSNMFKPEEQRRKAPEAILLHSPQKAPEHIGHVLVAGEVSKNAKLEPENNQTPAKIEKLHERDGKPLTERRVESLNRNELMEISEKIIVDGSSLRQIYETHLIGERGLRRLVAEHLRGGDLKKALRMEIVEREIDFERDPALRDMNPVGGAATGGGKAALNQLLEKANAKVGDNSEEAAFIRARADYEAKQYKQQHQQQKIVDYSLLTVILVLLSAVVFLVIMRG